MKSDFQGLHRDGLRALTTPAKGLGSIPAPTRQLTTNCNSGAKRSNAPFQPLQALGTKVGHGHTCRQNTFKKLKTILKLEVHLRHDKDPQTFPHTTDAENLRHATDSNRKGEGFDHKGMGVSKATVYENKQRVTARDNPTAPVSEP